MKLAIITGASSGMGREFALQLKRGGEADAFWLVARRKDRLESLAEELGCPCRIIPADLTTKEGLDAVSTALEEEKVAVKYLVNCAGYGKYGAFDEVAERDVVGMIDLNIKASVVLTHRILPYMEKGGHIINLGSGSCFTPLPYFNTYASSKSFILHYTKALRYETKKLGVTATCFCPGWVDTEFLTLAVAQKGVTHPKASAYKPLLKVDRVVAGAIRAAKRGRVMYVTGWYTKLQHLLFKLIPDSLLSKAWLGMVEKGE